MAACLIRKLWYCHATRVGLVPPQLLNTNRQSGCILDDTSASSLVVRADIFPAICGDEGIDTYTPSVYWCGDCSK